MPIVTTPTIDWLLEKAQACRKRLLISSPYVNAGIREITSVVSPSANKTLLTQIDLRDFALNASSLDTLCVLAREKTAIRVLAGLHAKVYVFDTSTALVTSANATFSGMHRNWECGIETSDKPIILALAKSVLNGFGAEERPRLISLAELEALYEPLAELKAKIPKFPKAHKPTAPPPQPEFSIQNESKFLGGFSGWQRLTLEGVMAIPNNSFSLDELVKHCSSFAAKRYPRNQHVRAKLRQQLQRLRDLGIVSFLGGGMYQRNIEAAN